MLLWASFINLDQYNQYEAAGMNGWIDRAAALEALKVRPQTLYAYVSRGLLRSEAIDGQRQRRYRADDVARLTRCIDAVVAHLGA